jgi:hypothetical protein
MLGTDLNIYVVISMENIKIAKKCSGTGQDIKF